MTKLELSNKMRALLDEAISLEQTTGGHRSLEEQAQIDELDREYDATKAKWRQLAKTELEQLRAI